MKKPINFIILGWFAIMFLSGLLMVSLEIHLNPEEIDVSNAYAIAVMFVAAFAVCIFGMNSLLNQREQ